MLAQPRAQQGPKAFHRMHVHFMKALTVVILPLFATAVTDACMRIALLFQAALIRVNTAPRRNRRLEQWLDRLLLDVVQPLHDHRATTLDHPEDQGDFSMRGCRGRGSP
jgi:hypothetical protein